MGEHLHVDAGLVHLLDAQRAEIEQALVGLARAPGFDAGEMGGHLRVPVVLLDGDHRTLRLVQHVRCAPSNGLRLSYRRARPAPSSVSPNLLWCGAGPRGRQSAESAACSSSTWNGKQEWNSDKHVEKILGRVEDGDVTVACWEPGQISPYHCHPEATEIYFCFTGGGRMRTPEREVEVTPGSFVVHPPGELHEYVNGERAHAAVSRALRRRHGGALPRTGAGTRDGRNRRPTRIFSRAVFEEQPHAK